MSEHAITIKFKLTNPIKYNWVLLNSDMDNRRNKFKINGIVNKTAFSSYNLYYYLHYGYVSINVWIRDNMTKLDSEKELFILCKIVQDIFGEGTDNICARYLYTGIPVIVFNAKYKINDMCYYNCIMSKTACKICKEIYECDIPYNYMFPSYHLCGDANAALYDITDYGYGNTRYQQNHAK